MGKIMLPHRYPARTVMHERLLELAEYSENLAKQPTAPQELATVGANARTLAKMLEQPLAAIVPNKH